MSNTEKPSPDDEWRRRVANVPLASVELVIGREDGPVLDKRENELVKDERFVRGGTVYKNEF